MSNWEKAVLGTALRYPDAFGEAEHLLPSDFTGSHRYIWSEILVLGRENSLDLRSVVERLRDADILDGVGSSDEAASGEAYINTLLQFAGTSMANYARQVLDVSIKRQIRMNAALIAAEADDDNISAEEALDNAERRLLSLRRNRLGEEGVTMADILGVFMPKFEGLVDGSYQPAWVPKCTAVRLMIDYVEDEDFIVGAARPGEGKSAYMRYEFYHNGRNGLPSLVFNLENSHTDYARNLIALDTGIDSRLIKTPRRLTEDQLDAIRQSVARLAALPLHIVTLGAPRIDEIERILRKKVTTDDIRWVGIDYIQLISNGLGKRVDDVTMSTGGARRMALRYKVPVFANSQLSRAITYRSENADPELSDLRDSGSLEQDGTIVMMYRHRWAAPTGEQLRQFPENLINGFLVNPPKAVPMDIYIKKHRNGVTGKCDPVLWVKSTGDFRTLERGALRE